VDHLMSNIRPATPADAAALAALFADPELAQWTDNLPFQSVDEWQADLQQQRKLGQFSWVAIENTNVVGYIKLSSFSQARRKHAVGIGPVVVMRVIIGYRCGVSRC
jgi:predicted N-acetyltransferase YhbS